MANNNTSSTTITSFLDGPSTGNTSSSSSSLASRSNSLSSSSNLVPATDDKPLSNFVTPLLTDMYQVGNNIVYRIY